MRLTLKSARWKTMFYLFGAFKPLELHHTSLCLQPKLSDLYFLWERKLRFLYNHMIQESGALRKHPLLQN